MTTNFIRGIVLISAVWINCSNLSSQSTSVARQHGEDSDKIIREFPQRSTGQKTTTQTGIVPSQMDSQQMEIGTETLLQQKISPDGIRGTRNKSSFQSQTATLPETSFNIGTGIPDAKSHNRDAQGNRLTSAVKQIVEDLEQKVERQSFFPEKVHNANMYSQLVRGIESWTRNAAFKPGSGTRQNHAQCGVVPFLNSTSQTTAQRLLFEVSRQLFVLGNGPSLQDHTVPRFQGLGPFHLDQIAIAMNSNINYLFSRLRCEYFLMEIPGIEMPLLTNTGKNYSSLIQALDRLGIFGSRVDDLRYILFVDSKHSLGYIKKRFQLAEHLLIVEVVQESLRGEQIFVHYRPNINKYDEWMIQSINQAQPEISRLKTEYNLGGRNLSVTFRPEFLPFTKLLPKISRPTFARSIYGQGVDLQLLETLQPILNFTPVFVPPSMNHPGTIISGNESDAWGMISQVFRGEVAFGFGDLWVDWDKYKACKPAFYDRTCVAVTVQQGQPIPNWKVGVTVATTDVWLGFLTTFVACLGFYVVLTTQIEVLESGSQNKDTDETHSVTKRCRLRTWFTRFRNKADVSENALQLLELLLQNQNKVTDNTKSWTLRFFFTSWIIFSFIFVTYYRSILTARLTVQEYTRPIHSLEELAESKILIANQWLLQFLVNQGDPRMIKIKKENRFVQTAPYPANLVDVEAGRCAHVQGERNAVFEIAMNFTVKGKPTIFVIPQCFLIFNIGWLGPRFSYLTPKVQSLLHGARNGGLMNKWFQDLEDQTRFEGLQRKSKKASGTNHSSAMNDTDDMETEANEKITIHHLSWAFVVYAIGTVCATLVLGYEVRGRRKKSKRARLPSHTTKEGGE